jgi:hypothetical protein
MATMAVAMLAVPLLDVIAKLPTHIHSPGQIGLARFAFQTVFPAVIMLARGVRPTRPTAAHGSPPDDRPGSYAYCLEPE